MAQRWQQDRPPHDNDPRRKFFCDLCQKGYARQIDLDHHENDYDHQHRKRERDLRLLSRDPQEEARAKAAERRARQDAGIKTISLNDKLNSEVKKAPIFKPIGASGPAVHTSKSFMVEQKLDPSDPKSATVENDPSGAVRNGWYRDQYNPNFITGCDSDCTVCRGRDEIICL